MKFHMDLPWGGCLHYERTPKEPMDWDKFLALVLLAGVVLVAALAVALLLGSSALKKM